MVDTLLASHLEDYSGAHIVALHRSDEHTFSKQSCASVELLAGLGVAEDCHSGARVQHRSRVAADPLQPNLRQVHLMQNELFTEVASAGFTVAPGELGENITTQGIDLLGLPVGTVLRLGDHALIALTGLRNPCGQINGHSEGLTNELRPRDSDGNVVRRAGVMSVVLLGGNLMVGDKISVALPPVPHRPLERI